MLGESHGEGLFEFVAAFEIDVFAPVQRLLCQGQRVSALGGDDARPRHRDLEEFVMRYHVEGRTPAAQGLCIDGLGGEEHPSHRLLWKHSGGEPASTEDADTHLRKAERRPVGGNHDVAQRGQRKTTAESGTVDGSDNG